MKSNILRIFMFCFLFSVFCLLLSKPAYAQSLDITAGPATWEIGTLKASATANTTSNNWTITNDSGGSEDFEIKVDVDAPGNWTACTDCVAGVNNNGADEFVLREDDDAGKLITGSYTSIATSVNNTGTYGLDLWFKAPPAGSTEETETLTVTIMATNYITCPGYWYAAKCWYLGGLGESCDAVCSSHGGCAGTYDDTSTCTVLKYMTVSTCESGCITGGWYAAPAAYTDGYGNWVCYPEHHVDTDCSISHGQRMRLCVCNE